MAFKSYGRDEAEAETDMLPDFTCWRRRDNDGGDTVVPWKEEDELKILVEAANAEEAMVTIFPSVFFLLIETIVISEIGGNDW